MFSINIVKARFLFDTFRSSQAQQLLGFTLTHPQEAEPPIACPVSLPQFWAVPHSARYSGAAVACSGLRGWPCFPQKEVRR